MNLSPVLLSPNPKLMSVSGGDREDGLCANLLQSCPAL